MSDTFKIQSLLPNCDNFSCQVIELRCTSNTLKLSIQSYYDEVFWAEMEEWECVARQIN